MEAGEWFSIETCMSEQFLGDQKLKFGVAVKTPFLELCTLPINHLPTLS